MLLYCLHASKTDLESLNLIFLHAKWNFSIQTEPWCNIEDKSVAADWCVDTETTSLLSGNRWESNADADVNSSWSQKFFSSNVDEKK